MTRTFKFPDIRFDDLFSNSIKPLPDTANLIFYDLFDTDKMQAIQDS